MPFQIDKAMKVKRSDIISEDRKEITCLLIDMSVPTERKLEKTSPKYKDLERRIDKILPMNTKTIPLKKEMEKYTNRICGNIKIEDVQEIVSTAYMLRIKSTW